MFDFVVVFVLVWFGLVWFYGLLFLVAVGGVGGRGVLFCFTF